MPKSVLQQQRSPTKVTVDQAVDWDKGVDSAEELRRCWTHRNAYYPHKRGTQLFCLNARRYTYTAAEEDLFIVSSPSVLVSPFSPHIDQRRVFPATSQEFRECHELGLERRENEFPPAASTAYPNLASAVPIVGTPVAARIRCRQSGNPSPAPLEEKM